jgi:protein gp37
VAWLGPRNRLGHVWPLNVWLGVSVKNANYKWRIGHVRHTGAAVKLLSLEPLLGPLDNLDLSGIQWAIVGGESGPNARPMRPVVDTRPMQGQRRSPSISSSGRTK